MLAYLKEESLARGLYQKASQAPDAAARMPDLILSIKNRLGDEAWARRLL